MRDLLNDVKLGSVSVKEATDIIAPFIALALLVRDDRTAGQHLKDFAADALRGINAPIMTIEQEARAISYTNAGHSRLCAENMALDGQSCLCGADRCTS